ncbi:hypothetical protein [Actinomycetospora termitidis]|uniref:Uncharacterized protein n=1 Tax=Actinomycetospora termitidis TaxID=3053470 RepID=A0ABT7MF23_9PSEU|nr:hypothetical protein [Actinomycetospora sp. Odt1-22]MDL5159262.1 hypothetical protein [Actinomycetospora sp. Odt1-22]
MTRSTGEYADIDMTEQLAALTGLGDDRSRGETVARILASPEQWCPAVLTAMASVVFRDGHHETGAFWFYAGQLRARYDAHRCTDPSAGAACGALTEAHGPPINRWAFAEPGLLPGLVDRVAAWDAATASDYDPRWIALHGMNAFLGSEGPLCVPREQWPEIAERARREFVEACHGLF